MWHTLTAPLFFQMYLKRRDHNTIVICVATNDQELFDLYTSPSFYFIALLYLKADITKSFCKLYFYD